jgi:hypothetical protein
MRFFLMAPQADGILVAVQAKHPQRMAARSARRVRAVNIRPVTCKVVAVNVQSVCGVTKKEGLVSRLEIWGHEKGKALYRRPKRMHDQPTRTYLRVHCFEEKEESVP